MSQRIENEQSRWVIAQQGTDVFEEHFLPARDLFGPALGLAYAALGERIRSYMEADPNGRLLYLGVGTGQEAKLLGIPPSQIDALDASEAYIRRAQGSDRLAGARFIHGVVPEALDTLPEPYYPVAMASEMLDCIPPSQLIDTTKRLKDRTMVMVVAQSYFPDDEFYRPYYPSNDSPEKTLWSVGKSGIEGWSQGQTEAVKNRIAELGIIADPLGELITTGRYSPEAAANLLSQLQTMVEKNIGHKFSFQISDILSVALTDPKIAIGVQNFFEQSGIPLDQRSYLARISGFMSIFSVAMEQTRNQLHTMAKADVRYVPLYIQMHTAHRFIQMLDGTLQQEFHFTVVEHDLREAGFSHISRRSVCANENSVITDEELGKELDRVLSAGFFPQGPKLESVLDDINNPQKQSKVFVLGNPALFLDPSSQDVMLGRIQYVEAA